MFETVWFDVHHNLQMYQVQDDLLLQVVAWTFWVSPWTSFHKIQESY